MKLYMSLRVFQCFFVCVPVKNPSINIFIYVKNSERDICAIRKTNISFLSREYFYRAHIFG